MARGPQARTVSTMADDHQDKTTTSVAIAEPAAPADHVEGRAGGPEVGEDGSAGVLVGPDELTGAGARADLARWATSGGMRMAGLAGAAWRAMTSRPHDGRGPITYELGGTPEQQSIRAAVARESQAMAVLRAHKFMGDALVVMSGRSPLTGSLFPAYRPSGRSVGDVLTRWSELHGAFILERPEVAGWRSMAYAVVCSNGVWLIAVASRTGRVVRTSTGRWYKPTYGLRAGDKDYTALLDDLAAKSDTVGEWLGGLPYRVPTYGALCLNGAEWGGRQQVTAQRGVYACSPAELVNLVSTRGTLAEGLRHKVRDVVVAQFARLAVPDA